MKRIELHTKQRVKAGQEAGYCVRYGLQDALVITNLSFARLAGKARRLSRHIGENNVDGFRYGETEQCNAGLAAVCIETWVFDEEGMTLKSDFFEKGLYHHTIVEKNGRIINRYGVE